MYNRVFWASDKYAIGFKSQWEEDSDSKGRLPISTQSRKVGLFQSWLQAERARAGWNGAREKGDLC